MGELEEKLNSILSSPQEMEKIMNLARSLSAGMGADGESHTSQQHNTTDTPDMSTITGGFDPKILGAMTRLMGEYSRPSDGKAAILDSIKPYLKKERREKLERAAEMAKMSRLARMAMNEFSKGGGDKDV
jgi:hypothetical protein